MAWLPATAGAAAFSNTDPISLPGPGAGSLYPSSVSVDGLEGSITETTVTIHDLSHAAPVDLGLVLVAPNNDALLLQYGAGGTSPVSNVTYTLSDGGEAQLPTATPWGPGTYRPTAHFANPDFPAPGPGLAYGQPGPAGGGTATFASTFTGDAPTGTWNLYAYNFNSGSGASIAGGWTLTLESTGGDTTPPETTIDSGPASGSTYEDLTPTFSFSSDEPGTFACSVDGRPFRPCWGPGDTHTPGPLQPGLHSFEVQATDVAGNVDASPAKRSFRTAYPKLMLGFSLKHLGANPGKVKGLQVAAPSMDRVLTAIRWKNVQHNCSMIRRGRFDWDHRADKVMERISNNGLTMVATLKDGPACTQTATGDNPKARYVDEWAAFARRLVKRYGPGGTFARARPLRAVEVWSEQNLTPWQGSPANYGRAFLTVERRVRRANRKVDVIVGGPGNCCDPAGYLKELFKDDRVRKRAELVGTHTYGRTPKQVMRRLHAVRDVVPGGAKLIITEHGWSTCPQPTPWFNRKCQTPEAQASKMLRYVQALRSARRRLRLTGFFWFQVQDMSTRESVQSCPWSPKNFYGIYNHAGSPKPAKYVWEKLTNSTLPESMPANTMTRGCLGDGALRILER